MDDKSSPRLPVVHHGSRSTWRDRMLHEYANRIRTLKHVQSQKRRLDHTLLTDDKLSRPIVDDPTCQDMSYFQTQGTPALEAIPFCFDSHMGSLIVENALKNEDMILLRALYSENFMSCIYADFHEDRTDDDNALRGSPEYDTNEMSSDPYFFRGLEGVLCPLCEKSILYCIGNQIMCACGLLFALADGSSLLSISQQLAFALGNHAMLCDSKPVFSVVASNHSRSLSMQCAVCQSFHTLS